MLDRSSKPQQLAEPRAGGGRNVDRLLFKNLVEMVPLVESLMQDRRANPAYSRRASTVYTPAPPKKATDTKSVKAPQSASAKKRRDSEDAIKKSTPDLNGENGSVAALSLSETENKPRDEMVVLRDQIDELQKKLLEKEEALRSAENLVSEMNEAYSTIDELRRQAAEKEALIRSADSQLQDAKIMLADKQASLEKLEWEVKMSNKKVEDLQGDVSNMEFEISSLMALFEKVSENISSGCYDASIPSSHELEALQSMSEIDRVEVEMIEQERITYAEALAAARENPSEEHLIFVAEARSRLQVCGTVLAVLEQDCKLTTLMALSSPLSTDQLSLDLCRSAMVTRHQGIARSQARDDRGTFALGCISPKPASSVSSSPSIQMWVTPPAWRQQVLIDSSFDGDMPLDYSHDPDMIRIIELENRLTQVENELKTIKEEVADKKE